MTRCIIVVFLVLAACSTPLKHEAPSTQTVPKPPVKRGGGYYQDDGPADVIPEDLDRIPSATPKIEPLHRFANRPYVALGKSYTPNTSLKPLKQTGIASWYGKKFHGQKTSIGETYDMFGMTAAHPTLAIPSYAKVTNPATGKSVVVRVNDRGPFHAGRVIDLSYAAAYQLGYVHRGSTQVEVEAITPDNMASFAAPPKDEIAALAEGMKMNKTIAPADLPKEVLFAPKAAALPAGFFLQVGAFSNEGNAENFKAHLLKEWAWLPPNEVFYIEPAGSLFRVFLGAYENREIAQKTADKIFQEMGFRPAFVLK